MSKFLVLHGKHAQAENAPVRDDDGNPLNDEYGNMRTQRIIRIYDKGEVVESRVNLCRRHNPPEGSGMSPKFQVMSDLAAQEYTRTRQEAKTATMGDVSNMNPVQQLQVMQQQILMLQQQLGNTQANEGDTIVQNQPINHPPGSVNASTMEGVTFSPGDSLGDGSSGRSTPADQIEQPIIQSPNQITVPKVPDALLQGLPKASDPAQKTGQAKLHPLPSAVDHMSLQELKEFAKAEEIDLGNVKSREEAAKKVKAAGFN